jgi:autotransporter-associated beta strand protein
MTRGLTTLLLLFAGASFGRAENFAWNADTNLKFFADAANWHTDGGQAAHAPGASDSIVSPLQHGVVSIAGPQEVSSFSVDLAKKWMFIGKGGLSVQGAFTKAGHELIVRDGGLANIDFDVTIGGELTLESGILRFGQEQEHGELHGLNVQGPVRVRDGSLFFRSTSAHLAGGLVVERGTVAIRQANDPGGITVRGIDGGPEGLICASTSGTLQPEAVLTIDIPDGRATYEGGLRNGEGGTLSLVKTGSGTQVLSGTENTFSGGVTISSGTLSSESAGASAVGSGPVKVAGHGIFSGTGEVYGSVEITESGMLAPGTVAGKAGRLAFKQGLTLGSKDAVLQLNLGPRTEDCDSIAGKGGPLLLQGRLVIILAGQPSPRSWKVYEGFSVDPSRHFGAVEVAGSATLRFVRNGTRWNAAGPSGRWAFEESTGVLSVAR